MKLRMGVGMVAMGLVACIACSADMSASDEATGVSGVELLVDGGTNAKSTLPV